MAPLKRRWNRARSARYVTKWWPLHSIGGESSEPGPFDSSFDSFRVVADAGGVSAGRAPAAAGSGELRRFTKSIGAVGNAQRVGIGQVGALAQGVVGRIDQIGSTIDLRLLAFQQIAFVVSIGPGGGRVGDAGGVVGGVVTVAHVVRRAGIVM